MAYDPAARNDYAEPYAEQEALMPGKLRANELFGRPKNIPDADEKKRPDQRGESIEDGNFGTPMSESPATTPPISRKP